MSLVTRLKNIRMHSKGEGMDLEMKKEIYEEPKVEIIVFEHEDIITTSGGFESAVTTPADEF